MSIYDLLFCNEGYAALYHGHHIAPSPKSSGFFFYAVVAQRAVHLSGRHMETLEKLRTGKRIPATQKVFFLHSVTEAVYVSGKR